VREPSVGVREFVPSICGPTVRVRQPTARRSRPRPSAWRVTGSGLFARSWWRPAATPSGDPFRLVRRGALPHLGAGTGWSRSRGGSKPHEEVGLLW